jgi:hypothetical protein
VGTHEATATDLVARAQVAYVRAVGWRTGVDPAGLLRIRGTALGSVPPATQADGNDAGDVREVGVPDEVRAAGEDGA